MVDGGRVLDVHLSLVEITLCDLEASNGRAPIPNWKATVIETRAGEAEEDVERVDAGTHGVATRSSCPGLSQLKSLSFFVLQISKRIKKHTLLLFS